MEGVLVLEGSDRIGGRVKDVKFGGITIELGANWVHRLIYNSFFSLINIIQYTPPTAIQSSQWMKFS